MPDLEPRKRPGPPRKVSPADKLINDLDGQYFKLSEAAEMLNVSTVTLRRLLRHPEVQAPTFQIKRGKMTVYVYTPEDIAEIKEFYRNSRIPMRRG